MSINNDNLPFILKFLFFYCILMKYLSIAILKQIETTAMKTLKNILIASVCILFTIGAKTQTTTVPAEFYLGKWAMQFKGLPQGDGKMVFGIEKKDSVLTGTVYDGAGNKIAGIDKIELNADNVTVYFSAGGYDVNVIVTKKDDNHITASLMSMFEAEGERVKEEPKSSK